MRTVNEVSRLSGVSVRTLHYYDQIGLLKPTVTTDAGYRLYDGAALKRLQSILLFRELRFSLREIKEILDSPGFDERQAIAQQKKLLVLERERVDRLIALAEKMEKKGVSGVEFEAFDNSELEQYKVEVREKWGNTSAYREYEARGSKTGQSDMMALFAAFGKLRGLDAKDTRVQRQIAALQQFITEHYYTCTNEILRSLGEMYTADERFRKNIDAAGGEGTAAFVQKAIAVYCE